MRWAIGCEFSGGARSVIGLGVGVGTLGSDSGILGSNSGTLGGDVGSFGRDGVSISDTLGDGAGMSGFGEIGTEC